MKRFKHGTKGKSIHSKALSTILALILVQAILFSGGIIATGLLESLNESARDNMSTMVSARISTLENNMISRWKNIEGVANDINLSFSLASQKSENFSTDVFTDENIYSSFLTENVDVLISLMRKNAVNGAFLILRDPKVPFAEDVESLAGIYLRDRDPTSPYTDQNLDLLFERAPTSVVKSTNISMDTPWMPMFNMSYANEEDNFQIPYTTALEMPNSYELSYYGYWSKPYTLAGDSSYAISYSLPLVTEDNIVYGVLGVEILLEYLVRSLPFRELGDNTGAYAINFSNPAEGLNPFAVAATDYRYTTETLGNLQLEQRENFFRTKIEDKKFVLIAQELSLYDKNTLYAGDNWFICAFMPESVIYSVTIKTFSALLQLLLVTLLISLATALILSHYISLPIIRLASQVRRSINREKQDENWATGVLELDFLMEGVTALNTQIEESAGKLSKMFQLSSIPIGAFEINRQLQTLFITPSFFALFGDYIENSTNIEEFEAQLESYKPYILPDSIDTKDNRTIYVYDIKKSEDVRIWVRISLECKDDIILGFAEDVSQEWRELSKLEFDRDHDSLTGILNRRGFYERYTQLLENPSALLNAALVMLDLDNLKYLNDTYGHDVGDIYINKAAIAIKDISDEHMLFARISGDEFLVFIHGYKDAFELKSKIEDLHKIFANYPVTFKGGGKYPLRVSGGIAYYAKDSKDPYELVRFADFAMYRSKHSQKGTFVNFDLPTYKKESYLLQSTAAFEELIETKAVTYYFQPIVSATTGEIFAYEALMRSKLPALRSPGDILSVAKIQSRLGEIEKLTWFEAMKSFAENSPTSEAPENCHIFINSIPGQILSESSWATFEEMYGQWLHRIVIEYTEEETDRDDTITLKANRMKSWNAKIALDDYGSGYSNESMLLNTDLDFLKIDMEIVRNIDTNLNRQQRVSSLLEYTKPRGILVIAEGIETVAEMETLHRIGVDFFQGYFLCQPKPVPSSISQESLKLLQKLNQEKVNNNQ